MPLATNDIESELSYAYLHAVVARAGCDCGMTGRHSDGMGVDARIFVDDEFGAEAPLCRFSVEVQLKATRKEPALVRGRYAYRLRKEHYDKLRRTDVESPVLLVVLFLPEDAGEWLRCTAKALTLKGCAYWVSLYNGPECDNASSQTVYLPRANVLSADSFRALLSRFARRERIPYVG